jgi:hypothetical protein
MICERCKLRRDMNLHPYSGGDRVVCADCKHFYPTPWRAPAIQPRCSAFRTDFVTHGAVSMPFCHTINHDGMCRTFERKPVQPPAQHWLRRLWGFVCGQPRVRFNGGSWHYESPAALAKMPAPSSGYQPLAAHRIVGQRLCSCGFWGTYAALCAHQDAERAKILPPRGGSGVPACP